MALLTETFPRTAAAINQKIDVQAVPVGQEDNWWSAADSNRVGQLLAVERALRLQAAITALSPASAGINNLVFRFTGIDATTGLGQASTSIPTDLNKLFAAAVEKIEQGGDLDGTASASGFMGVYAGLVSAVSGTYAAGVLLGVNGTGGLITYVAGALPPIGIGIDAKTAYVDVSGRLRMDNSTIEVDVNGQARVKSGAVLTLGNTDINGTLSVSGVTTLSAALIVAGAVTLSGAVDIQNTLNVSGAATFSSSLNVQGDIKLDARVSMAILLLSGSTGSAWAVGNLPAGTTNGQTKEWLAISIGANTFYVPAVQKN